MKESHMPLQSAHIVGLGAVTAYGWGVDATWNGLKSGQTAARCHAGLGGRFPDPCWFARVPEPPGESTGTTRYAQAFRAAAEEALDDATRSGWRPGRRVGIVHATTRGDLELMRSRYLAWDDLNPRRAYVEQAWTKPAGDVMSRHGFTGPAIVVSAACSSGLHALTIAQRLLTCGDATDVIVVSADVGFDGEEMRLFASLSPLIHDSSPFDACRPFQAGSRGFVLGEGVAALVLCARPAEQHYVKLLSTVVGNDAYHPTSIKPDHEEYLRIAGDALAAANVDASQVCYFSAHASGTAECAKADLAMVDYLGPQVRAYGLKPFYGHCMGTAPLLDTVAMAKAYRECSLPVPAPVAEAHPQFAASPLRHGDGPTLQVAIGFGGNLSAAVFDRADHPSRPQH